MSLWMQCFFHVPSLRCVWRDPRSLRNLSLTAVLQDWQPVFQTILSCFAQNELARVLFNPASPEQITKGRGETFTLFFTSYAHTNYWIKFHRVLPDSLLPFQSGRSLSTLRILSAVPPYGLLCRTAVLQSPVCTVFMPLLAWEKGAAHFHYPIPSRSHWTLHDQLCPACPENRVMQLLATAATSFLLAVHWILSVIC